MSPPTKTYKNSNMIIEKLNSGIFQYSIYFDSINSNLKRNLLSLQNNECDDDFITFDSNESYDPPSHKQKNKTVQFNLKPTIHLMYVWSFAYAQARKDQWQEIARDRVRFRRKIDEMSKIITPALLKKQIKFNNITRK